MPSAPLPPEKQAEIEDLAQAIREAVDAEIDELAANLATTDDAHLFGDNEFKIRALAHKIAAKAVEQHLARKKTATKGAGVTCPHCGQAAEFHSHRAHTSLSLVGPIRYRRAYYLCRRCGKGLFPFDRDAGLTTRDLTPALERVATLAGAVADSFEKGAELLEEMAGVRLSESTVERTTEDAGRRLADAVAAGATFGPQADWPWHKDYEGKRCAYVELDATGVRQQGAGGGPAEGRMAYVGMVCNPGPGVALARREARRRCGRATSRGCTRWRSSPRCSARPPGTSAWTGPTAGSACPTAATAWRTGCGRTSRAWRWSSSTSSTRRRSSPGWRGCCTPRTRTEPRSRRGSGGSCSRTKAGRCWRRC